MGEYVIFLPYCLGILSELTPSTNIIDAIVKLTIGNIYGSMGVIIASVIIIIFQFDICFECIKDEKINEYKK